LLLLKKYFINFAIKLLLWFFKKEKNDRKIYLTPPNQILIVQLGNYQEALNVTPLIKIVKEKLQSSISVMVKKKSSQVLQNNKSIDRIIVVDEDDQSLIKLMMNLRKIKFNVVIDISEKFNNKTALILGLLNAYNKIGFLKDNLNLLTHYINKLDSNKVHIVDRLLHLTEAFELEFSTSNLNIVYQPSAKSKNAIEDYLIKHDLSYKMITIINISTELEIGFWGEDSYKRLLKYLRNYNSNIIIASSMQDIKMAEKIAGGNHLLYYNTDFDQYAQLLRSSDFIFSPDSFSIQLAAAFKIPVFCLFVQHKSFEMINVPYNSDFDFCLTEKPSLADISFGKVLNSFIPYFEYVYQKYESSGYF